MNDKQWKTLDDSELATVFGGSECTIDDPNGDGVIDDQELEEMMLRANGLPLPQ